MAITPSTTVGRSARAQLRTAPQRTRVYHAEDRRWRDPQSRCCWLRQEPSFNWADDVEDDETHEDELDIGGYALTVNSSAGESFLIDSGATDHLTGNFGLFSIGSNRRRVDTPRQWMCDTQRSVLTSCYINLVECAAAHSKWDGRCVFALMLLLLSTATKMSFRYLSIVCRGMYQLRVTPKRPERSQG